MSAKSIRALLSIIAVLAMLPVIITAGSTGRIKGTVTDKETGDPITGASVEVVGTALDGMADPDGKYFIPSVPSGKYTLKFTAIGYETVEVTELTVRPDQTATQDVRMKKIVTDLSKAIKVDAERALVTTSLPAGVVKMSNEQSIQGYFPPAHGGTAIVNGEPFDAMFFKDYGTNPFVDTEDDHLSTFAIDVDDASYIMTRSYLEQGHLPPDEAVRTEEFINHFRYNYESPEEGPFSISFEGAPSKFGQNCQLLRIGIKGKEVRPENRKAANLVFVIDVSGSMSRENRLGLVRKALRILVDNLESNDRVGIVVYGSRGRVVLEPTSIQDKEKILSAIEWLQPEGATNAEEGLRLGYYMAEKNFEKGKINRIILCSDGVANVGVTGAEELLKWIRKHAEKGITLTTVGFGMGNYNDILMEKLGNKGNGHYAYVDDIAEAKRIFLENLTGMLQVIARDVKIQVDFDPETVRSYRLLGYENRDVADDKFRDDKEDGGEIGSGHQVTALYEIKFQKGKSTADVGTVYIRYKHPENETVSEVSRRLTMSDFRSRFRDGTIDFKLAAAAAEFAEILGKSYWARDSKLSDVYELAREIFSENDSDQIAEFVDLISKAEKFQDELAEK